MTNAERRLGCALAVIAFLVIASSCGPDAKQAALRSTLTGLNAARDGFTTWDDQKQQRIVAEATSLDDGKQKLNAYREERVVVLTGFELAYKVLAVAALDPSWSTIKQAIAAVADVYETIRKLAGDAIQLPKLPKGE